MVGWDLVNGFDWQDFLCVFEIIFILELFRHSFFSEIPFLSFFQSLFNAGRRLAGDGERMKSNFKSSNR